ncbi:MAG: ROK family transcriptional regulator [Anaerolineaceae bacterium]|nr:MAG: ROK family transcriptional regulator [Anaerolineaceae bacterium]
MKKATRQHTRAHNKQLVLRTIFQQEATSRADIARSTHLTRTTVSHIVAELITEGLIEESGRGPSEGGKPPVLLEIVPDSRNLIGIDLANSAFHGGVFDLRGNLIQRIDLPVHDRNGPQALALVSQLSDSLLDACNGPVLGIGIGTPGLVNARDGIVRRAVNLDWRDLPMRSLLEARYDLPVYVSNDSHAAALGEYAFGQKREIANLIVIKVGRGTSAGIVLNGRLHYGDGSGAGEIGHVRVVEEGAPCLCGQTGCLETVVSSRAIVKKAGQLLQNKRSSTLQQFVTIPEEITTDIVLQAFEAGDEAIRQMIVEAGRYLGIATAYMVGVLNVQHIFIAGSLARFGETLLDAVRYEMQERAMSILAQDTHIKCSHLGQDIVMLGAASHLLTNELGSV